MFHFKRLIIMLPNRHQVALKRLKFTIKILIGKFQTTEPEFYWVNNIKSGLTRYILLIMFSPSRKW